MKHNWEYKPIGDCFAYIKNGANIKQEKEAGGLPVTRIETLSNGVFNRSKMGYANIFEIGKYEPNVLNNGDLLMSHINSKTYVGRTVIYESLPNEVIIHGMNLLRLIPNDAVRSKFFYYTTLSHYFKSKIVNIRKDSVNQSSFSISDLKKISIPVPPMEVQERIVAELDKINETIEDCRELLRNLDALSQSLFYDFFGDPITNTKGWKSQTLAELCTVTSSNRIFAEEYCDEGIPFYRGKEISELSRGEKISIELFISANRYEKLKSANNVPQINDILITAVGTIGNIWVVDTLSPFYFKDGNIIWLKDINFKVSNSKYFRYLLYRLIDIEKNKMVNGSAYKALTIQNLKKLSVFLPPLSLQEKFAERIEQIETQKKIVESTIAELQTLLDSRMDYWFN